MAINKWQVPSIASDAFEKAFTPTNICAGFTKAGIHPFDPDWVVAHEHVFAVSKSLEQPTSEDALTAIRLKKFDDLSAGSCFSHRH